MALDYQDESDDDWEYAEALLTESLHDGDCRGNYFISILEDCDTRYSLEADFGAGKFLRSSQPGNIIIGDEESVQKLQGKGPYHTYMIFIKKCVVDDFFREATQSDQGLPEHLLRMSFRDEKLRLITKQIFQHFRQPRNVGRRMIKEYLQNQVLERLLAISGKKINRLTSDDTLQPTRLIDILDYMREHCTEDLSLNQLAEHANVSRSHFVRLFRQTTGESPKQFLLKLKLERAKQLLATAPHLSVLEVARTCGFYDQSHLARVLRQAEGITPTLLRREPFF
ncbi:AraC family transcriptional regulator [Blastopirellula sp. J2-11]|uniref:AraC family transcriptional regulator n=1 Tax=Blastopirellula sp. J2-11 TaxID=2943192 RepID=UPI0021C963C1|nr:AraC family transcriptional regulator [Blastopirellula sp. J2-11]UUO08531.1 AraC family transcriptional regulator [Blastopirellula sp. J2-11]